jgi:hypothetical protein
MLFPVLLSLEHSLPTQFRHRHCPTFTLIASCRRPLPLLLLLLLSCWHCCWRIPLIHTALPACYIPKPDTLCCCRRRRRCCCCCCPAGIAAGRYHQGALRVSRFSPFEGWVSSEAVGADILISGRIDMNRAVDGERGTKSHVCCSCVDGWDVSCNFDGLYGRDDIGCVRKASLKCGMSMLSMKGNTRC